MNNAGKIEYCKKCGRHLTHNEIGLHKKLFNRGADSFYCIDCCAEYFEVSKELVEKKIVQFKEMGCTLFE